MTIPEFPRRCLALLVAKPHSGVELLDKFQSTYGASLNPGTMYVTLARLRKAGFVESESIGTGFDRLKEFSITASGHRELARHREYLANELRVVDRGLEEGGGLTPDLA